MRLRVESGSSLRPLRRAVDEVTRWPSHSQDVQNLQFVQPDKLILCRTSVRPLSSTGLVSPVAEWDTIAAHHGRKSKEIGRSGQCRARTPSAALSLCLAGSSLSTVPSLLTRDFLVKT